MLVATLSLACLGLASLQAGLLYVQNRLLRTPLSPLCLSIAHRIPPLQTMERFLFQMMSLGFILLSISLCNAFLYLGDQLQAYQEKIMLCGLTWLLFAFLLYRHYRFGFRGLKAIQWTFIGLALLGSVFLAARLRLLNSPML